MFYKNILLNFDDNNNDNDNNDNNNNNNNNNACKVFCPEAGPSLDMHYHGSTYLNLLEKRNE